jgi:hypothetical protein
MRARGNIDHFVPKEAWMREDLEDISRIMSEEMKRM